MNHRPSFRTGDDGRSHWYCLCGTGWGLEDTDDLARHSYAIHAARGLGGGTGDFRGQPGVDLWMHLRLGRAETVILDSQANPMF